MVELTKRERRNTSFPTRKITEEEARKGLKKAVLDVAIAKYELEHAKLEMTNAISHLEDGCSMYVTERLEKASKWLNSANRKYHDACQGLSLVKEGCYESEIPIEIVKEYTKGVIV